MFGQGSEWVGEEFPDDGADGRAHRVGEQPAAAARPLVAGRRSTVNRSGTMRCSGDSAQGQDFGRGAWGGFRETTRSGRDGESRKTPGWRCGAGGKAVTWPARTKPDARGLEVGTPAETSRCTLPRSPRSAGVAAPDGSTTTARSPGARTEQARSVDGSTRTTSSKVRSQHQGAPSPQVACGVVPASCNTPRTEY